MPDLTDDLPLFGAGTRLAHVAVPVRDIALSSAFYERLGFVPGFTRTDADGRMSLRQMNLIGFFIELIRADAPVPGGGHVGLRVADANALHAALLRQGFAPDAPPRRGQTGVAFFFIRDPDGNSIEFVSA